MRIPVSHLRPGDRADHWTFISGAFNSTGMFIATWITPTGKLRVLAHFDSEGVFASSLSRI